MIHLASIALDRTRAQDSDSFAFAIPALRELETLTLTRPITLLVGENGSGKSTLLEALAWATESLAAGRDSLETDTTLEHVLPLGRALRPVWQHRTRRGFFLRAEDFFGLVRRTNQRMAELKAEGARVRAENAHLHEGELDRIASPYEGSAAALRARYGEDMDARSHGEQFLAFFAERLVPRGLYLLDEPEVPLSPMRQLALLSMLKQAAEEHECQFVIATHSPILMALPGAAILSFDHAPICQVAFEDVEHVSLMRDFLKSPERYLRHL